MGQQRIRCRGQEAYCLCGAVLDAREAEVALTLGDRAVVAELPVAARTYSHAYAALDASVVGAEILLAAHLEALRWVEPRERQESK